MSDIIRDPKAVKRSVKKLTELLNAVCECPVCHEEVDLCEGMLCATCGSAMCFACATRIPNGDYLCGPCYRKRLADPFGTKEVRP